MLKYFVIFCLALAPNDLVADDLTAVKYRSDVKGSGYEWLEIQQRAAYGPAGRPLTLAELKRVIASLPPKEGWKTSDEILKTVKVEDLKLPTRYEDIGSYFLLENISQDVRRAAESIDAKTTADIEWGTLPTGA